MPINKQNEADPVLPGTCPCVRKSGDITVQCACRYLSCGKDFGKCKAPELLGETALNKLYKTVNCELLVAAVSNDADLSAANDTKGKDTEQ